MAVSGVRGCSGSPTFTAPLFVVEREAILDAGARTFAQNSAAERRGQKRAPVVVPATVMTGTQDSTAKLLNIVPEGAMLETSTPLPECSAVVVRLGTLAVEAEIVWRKLNRVGVKFKSPLSDDRLRELLARSDALRERLSLRSRAP